MSIYEKGSVQCQVLLIDFSAMVSVEGAVKYLRGFLEKILVEVVGGGFTESSKGFGLWRILHWRPSRNRSELVNSRCWALWRDSSLFLLLEAVRCSSIIRRQTWLTLLLLFYALIHTPFLPFLCSTENPSMMKNTQNPNSKYLNIWFLGRCLFVSAWWIKNENGSTAHGFIWKAHI